MNVALQYRSTELSTLCRRHHRRAGRFAVRARTWLRRQAFEADCQRVALRVELLESCAYRGNLTGKFGGWREHSHGRTAGGIGASKSSFSATLRHATTRSATRRSSTLRSPSYSHKVANRMTFIQHPPHFRTQCERVGQCLKDDVTIGRPVSMST
jgi:hypothetical protein